MQKSTIKEYIQAILYHLRYYWQKIVIVIFVIATVVLELIYNATGYKKIYYYCGLITALCAVLLCIIIYANKIADKLGIWKRPQDEK